MKEGWKMSSPPPGKYTGICSRYYAIGIGFSLPFRPSPGYSATSRVDKGSAAKRVNMFIRWMVRHDHSGIDFGLWKGIPASALLIPLDLHTGHVSRELGLLTRKQNDAKAVEELTRRLREFDPVDPIRYDFALFGLGAFK